MIRTETLIGGENVNKLRNARVAVFGIGGVGAACAEALARSGVGHLVLIDPDTVSESNLNRQLVALRSTVGKNKAQVMKERIADIFPECEVTALPLFYEAGNADTLPFTGFDGIADCIDTVTSKLLIIRRARENGVRVISALGTGNKLHPEMLELADIYATSVCPLARVMRKRCRENGIEHLQVVYSREEARHMTAGEENGRHPPASMAFVPNAAGMIMASKLVRDIIGE